MGWAVVFDEAFAAEFAAFPRDAQTALLAMARLLEWAASCVSWSNFQTASRSRSPASTA